MLTPLKINETLGQIRARAFGVPLRVKVRVVEAGYLIHVEALLPDNAGDDPQKLFLQKGGKLFVSSHATHHELVLKVWQAVQAFVLHELRESFTYQGVMIFQPHLDVDALAQHMATTAPVHREPTESTPPEIVDSFFNRLASRVAPESTVNLDPVS